MKKLILIFVFFASTSVLFGQQDPQFSQNYFNRLFPNPAFAGSNDAICANLLGRNQWVGFDGKPETYLLTAHMPFTDPWLGQSHGVGLSVLSDKLGQESTIGFKLAYSFKIPVAIGPGNLRVGLGLGMINKSISNDWNAVDDFSFDPSIPDAGASDLAFDMDFGLYYEIPKKLYIGLSSTHINQSDLQETAENPNGVASNFGYGNVRHYYLMAGYEYQINPDFTLKPNMFMRTDAVSASFDIGALIEYQEMFWGGLSYRYQDAIIPTAGLRYAFAGTGVKGGTLKVGYSYDVTTSLLRQHSSGSHEIMIGYCFSIQPKIKREVHKTVRFL